MFKKVLVANRGEIALRIIRACREMKIGSVAVYSEADANSLHVRAADESVCIGPPPNRDSYLNMPNIISAAIITGADAIHPGYGYFSEQPNFAEACEACNITFIGPSPAAMEQMGDKAKAREAMIKAGIPVIPGTKGSVDSEQEAFRAARKIGYPLRIKASAGGGGRGQRVVQNEDELANAVKVAQAEAEAAFGCPDIYIEKEIEDPRHIEVQILGDKHGHVVHLGERDCSVQTARYQKMIEEAPSVGLTPGLRAKIGEAAVKAAKAVSYSNAGTVEFLVDKKLDYYFMEMNTRLQVEHPVTEAITGIDVVQEQIRVADGEKLSFAQKDVQFRGHSIECRITAEDPENGFRPTAGTIDGLVLPGGFGVRLDTHIYAGYIFGAVEPPPDKRPFAAQGRDTLSPEGHAGYQTPPYYDSLLAKLIVWGKDRPDAINRMVRCLDEFHIGGIKTNIEYHKKIMSNAYYRKGEVSISFLSRRMTNGQ